MTDIVSVTEGLDLGMLNSLTPRAGNIFSVQLGSLEYAPETFGIDLSYFLSEEFKVQNASFKSYLIEVLANSGISVASLTDRGEALFREYIFEISPDETSTGLIAR